MSDKNEQQQLIDAFFSLWQQESAAALHQPDIAEKMLDMLEAQTQTQPTSADEKTPSCSPTGETHDLPHDAAANLFRHLVEQLSWGGNSTGKDAK